MQEFIDSLLVVQNIRSTTTCRLRTSVYYNNIFCLHTTILRTKISMVMLVMVSKSQQIYWHKALVLFYWYLKRKLMNNEERK